MPPRNAGYINDVDDLIHSTRPWEAAAFYGMTWPEGKYSGNVRLRCLFNENCNTSSYGQLSVNVDKQHSPIYCHGCGIRGKLIELMYGMKHGQPFDGTRLRGEQFKGILSDLRMIRSGGPPQQPQPKPTTSEASPQQKEPVRNTPLKDSENERARALVNLDENFVVDPAEMNSAAAVYFRQRPWLTPEVAERWRMGYLPNSAKGLLRGRVVYGFADEADDILSWFGRDPDYAQKRHDWEQRGCPEKGQPIKTRFVKGFQRGLELYGQNGAVRLEQTHVRSSLEELGLLVVEGPNDVVRLDELGVAAVGLCSNKATEAQIEKITRYAREHTRGRVALMLDNDDEGEAGAKELLWQLNHCDGVAPRLGWSRELFSGRFADRQPESLSPEEWTPIRDRLVATQSGTLR